MRKMILGTPPLKNVDKLIKGSLSKDFMVERQCFNEVTFHPSCLLNILIPRFSPQSEWWRLKTLIFLGKLEWEGSLVLLKVFLHCWETPDTVDNRNEKEL
jgi:hypothetical protein